MRSLTKRPAPATKSPSPEPEQDEKGEEEVQDEDTKTDSQDVANEGETVQRSRSESRPKSIRTSSPVSNRISNVSDSNNVNLDDEKGEREDQDKDTKSDRRDITNKRETIQSSSSEVQPRSIRTSSPVSNRILNTSDLDNVNLDDEKGEGRDQDKGRKTESQDVRTSSPGSTRISNTSNLDNVNLDDENPTKMEGTGRDEDEHMNKDLDVAYVFLVPPTPPEKDHPSKTVSLNSITNGLPPMPWSPPAEPPAAEPPLKSPVSSLNAPAPAPTPAPLQQPGPPSRKLASAFSWLSRNSSGKDKDVASLPTQPTGRRNTCSSIATSTSNPEMMLSKLDEEFDSVNSPNGSQRESLKDRFKVLRMREEAGILLTSGEHDGQGDAVVLASPISETLPADKNQERKPSNANHDLAPGTAPGVNAEPSARQESQVDWDLWQSVVYEGPAAVARTSPEELNRAIATGIPHAIRGVIWQVLAQSKNEHLEVLYKDLVARGSGKQNRNSGSTTSSSASNEGIASSINGDSVKSSASSVRSSKSATNESTSPKPDKNQEAVVRAWLAVVAEKKKKQKEEAAAIQKLEKIIRRDLGARTSFSKYTAAAGLQEGLFGVCKAYALFDEGVGYAQGMNFLIMPLLFNVSAFCAFKLLSDCPFMKHLMVKILTGPCASDAGRRSILLARSTDASIQIT